MSKDFPESIREALPSAKRVADVRKKFEKAGVKYVLCCWIDMLGIPKTKPVPIEQQSDRVDWRIFVSYPPGSFDLATGLGSGWRETPRFRHLGVEFYAPSRTLESIDR